MNYFVVLKTVHGGVYPVLGTYGGALRLFDSKKEAKKHAKKFQLARLYGYKVCKVK